jgi:uncharacterized protein (DUF1015 family)
VPLIQPFRALRPAPARAAEILAPPYDVLSSDEARAQVQGKPWSFLHVSKPEIDLDPATDPYDDAVYDKAAANFRRMIAERVLIRDSSPCYYVYRLTRQGHEQTGIAAVASIADYTTNRIRKHELTTHAKEDDRVRQIDAIDAQTGPVMHAYPSAPQIDSLIARSAEGAPLIDVTADDGVRHQLWIVDDPNTIASITRAFDALPATYICDGHHRSAAAARIAATRGEADPATQYFLSVLFPHHEMTILDYNRVVRDLNGMSPAQFIEALGKSFTVTPSGAEVRPASAGELGMVLGGRWYRLTIRPDLIPADPVGRLPISLLTNTIIEPLLGIADQRKDKRIDFIGGGRGLGALAARVASGEMAVAFALYPTQMKDLMAVADAGGIMPPKSTWFEPKLADGMVSHILD